MRETFFKLLIELAEKDKDIIFLTDDLGYSFYEEFKGKFPQQFINCGVIEQSMTGIAAGLALGGKKPYIYGTIPFVIMRNYEQLRDDICYNNLNVKVIGTSHSGFLGFSHNLEGNEKEVDLLKNLPNIEVYIPNTKRGLELVLSKKDKKIN